MTARIRRIFIACLVLALLLAPVVWLARRPTAAGVEAPPMSVAASAAMAASAEPRLATAPSPEVTSAGRPAAAVAAAGRGAEAAAGGVEIPPDGIEVCGVRRVPADELRHWQAEPDRGKARAEAMEAQTQRIGEAGLAKIAARLAAGNDHQQVAARLLMKDLDGAVLLAERSGDALAYQLALTACGYEPTGSPRCPRLNAARWAELDPSDARPWLRLLAEAQLRNDATGVVAALAEAVARPRLSRGGLLLEAQAAAVADAVPDDAELGHALLATNLIYYGMFTLDVAASFRVCSADALKDPVRRGHCRTLARQTLANATELSDAVVAQKLADRVGVPREQQAHDAATLKAAQERMTARNFEGLGVHCAALRQLKQTSTERAAAGELAMALALARQPAR